MSGENGICETCDVLDSLRRKRAAVAQRLAYASDGEVGTQWYLAQEELMNRYTAEIDRLRQMAGEELPAIRYCE